MIEEFNYIYENKIWGNDFNNIYSCSSGGGCEINYNIHIYIPFIQTFIEQHNIKSVCDLGCGKLIEPKFNILNVIYYGYDCYSKVIVPNKIKLNESKYNSIYLDFFTYYNAIIIIIIIIIQN